MGSVSSLKAIRRRTCPCSTLTMKTTKLSQKLLRDAFQLAKPTGQLRVDRLVKSPLLRPSCGNTFFTAPTPRNLPHLASLRPPSQHDRGFSSSSVRRQSDDGYRQNDDGYVQSEWHRDRPHRRASTVLPPGPVPETPSYALTFTCKPCNTRSSHYVSKQGYHNGSVLISCPNPDCKSRHIMSDHLRIFTEEGGDLEEILKRHSAEAEKQGVKKGTLNTYKSVEGREGETPQDVEFWEDGTLMQSDVDIYALPEPEIPEATQS